MTVFRSEVLLDVVLAAASILLILLILVRSGSIQTDHFRQSSIAIGCFAAPDGTPWSDEYAIYARASDEGNGDAWRLLEKARGELKLRSALKRAMRPDEGFTRAAILIDFSGSPCALDGKAVGRALNTVLNDLPSLPGFEGWTIQTELVPCRDHAHCESLLRVPASKPL